MGYCVSEGGVKPSSLQSTGASADAAVKQAQISRRALVLGVPVRPACLAGGLLKKGPFHLEEG